MEIRHATATDLEGICAIISENFPMELVERIRTGLSDDALRNKTTSFIAIDGTQIIGHGAVTLQSTTVANFHAFAVSERYQHKGTGQHLVRAALEYLRSTEFEGLAHANCVTHHLGSQKIFYTAGFSPMNTHLAKDPDFGIGQRETNIGFALLYSKQTPPIAPLYIPKQYYPFTRRALAPFCTPSFAERGNSEVSDRLREFLAKDGPDKRYAIRAYEKTAPAEMENLLSRGYHIIGVYPLIEQGEIRTRLYMMPAPSDILQKGKIQVLPSAKYIFDFVWRQYVQGRR